MTVSALLMRSFSAIASVTEAEDLDAVAAKLALHGLGAVVVLDAAGRLTGIITDGHLVAAFARRKSELPILTAKDIMDRDVHTCRSDETELDVMTVMVEKHIRHMAVTLGENVVGLVTLDEAVRHRLQKVRQLNERAAREPDDTRRLALVDRHMEESWSIFQLFQAVTAVQEDLGLAELDDRAKRLLWLIGTGDEAGKALQVKDLMVGHKWGTFPTVRRLLDELMGEGFVEYVPGVEGRGKPFRLSQRGRDAFRQMAKAVIEAIQPRVPAGRD